MKRCLFQNNIYVYWGIISNDALENKDHFNILGGNVRATLNYFISRWTA